MDRRLFGGHKSRAEIRFVHHRFGRLAKASITGVCHYADDYSIGSENIQVLAQWAPIREELAGYSRADYYYRLTLHSVLFGQRAAREKRYPVWSKYSCGAAVVPE